MCFVHHWSGTITFIINYRVVDVFFLLLFFSSLFFTIHVVLGEYFIIFYLGEYLINNFANEFDMIGIVIYIQPLPWLLPLLLIPSPFHTSHSYDLQKKKRKKKTKTSEILRKHTNIDFPDSDNPKLFSSAVFEVTTVNKSGLTVCYVHNFLNIQNSCNYQIQI